MKRSLSAWLAAGFLLCATGGLQAALPREPGAIYLEDVLEERVRLPLPQPTRISYDIGLARYLGTLRAGQQIEVQAVADHAVRVKGRAQQGDVAGWVRKEDLPGLKPDFLASVKQAAERKRMVDELIEKNEVAVGMTPDEVTKSLGKPQRKSSRMDAEVRLETWEFIRYARVPQVQPRTDIYGRLFYDTVYVKVPAGRLAVTFNNGVVSEVQQTEGEVQPDYRPRILVPPIEVY